jgi:hypothetical protein
MISVESEESEEVVIVEEPEIEELSEAAAVEPPPMHKTPAPRASSGGGLSKKAGELHQRLQSRGIDLKKSLIAGVNPLENKKPAYLSIVIERLLAEKQVTRQWIVNTFIQDLRWSEATAQSHVSIGMSVLTYFECVVVTDGVLHLVESE